MTKDDTTRSKHGIAGGSDAVEKIRNSLEGDDDE